MRRLSALLLIISASSLVGCGGGDGPGQISASLTVVSVSAPRRDALADGIDHVEIAVVVRDASGSRLPQQMVRIAVSGSANTLSAEEGQTAADGSAKFWLSSTKAEEKDIAVQVDGAPVRHVSAVFTAGPAATLSFLQQPFAGTAGIALGDVIVAVSDVHGNLVELSEPVALSLASAPTGAALLGAATTFASTGAVATFRHLSVQKSGSYRLRVTCGPLQVDGSPFVVSADAPSLAGTSVSLSSPTITAGEGSAAVVVRVLDEYGNSVAGVPVGIVSSGSDDIVVQPPDVTDGDGLAIGWISSTKAEAKTISALAGGVVPESALLTVLPGPPLTANLAGPAREVVGTPAVLEALIEDAYGNPVPFCPVSFATTLGTISVPVEATDRYGTASVSVSSTIIGQAAVTADFGNSRSTAALMFVAGPPAASTSAVAVAAAIGTNNGTPVAISATIRDLYANPVAGAKVIFSSSGPATIVQPASLTGNDGVATGTISSTTEGAQTVTATVDGVALASALLTFKTPVRIVSRTGPDVVVVGGAATYGVTVEGTPPFNFLWFKNGVMVAKQLAVAANAVSFTTPAVSLADNGAGYVIMAHNDVGDAVGPSQFLNVVELAPGEQIFRLFSNVPEMYPVRQALALAAVAPVSAAVGIVATVTSAGAAPTNLGWTSAGAAWVQVDGSTGAVTMSSPDVSASDVLTGTVTLWPEASPQTTSSLELSYTSAAFLSALGQTGPGRVAVTKSGLPWASPTRVEDWILGWQPTPGDIAFAQATWGGIIAPFGSPVQKAQALARALIDELEPHRGVPSDRMNTSPFQQYQLAMSGQDHVWCVNIAAIFTYACNCLGIPARIPSVGRTYFTAPDYNLVANGHATTEIFDATLNRWVWIDPTLYLVGMQGPGQRLLDAVEMQRGLNDPTQFASLTAFEYAPGSGMESPVPLPASHQLTALQEFFSKEMIISDLKVGLQVSREHYSNEADLFPRDVDVAIRSIGPIPGGYGVRLGFISTIPDLDHFEYDETNVSHGGSANSGTRAGIVNVAPGGLLDIQFDNPAEPFPQAKQGTLRAVGSAGESSAQYVFITQFFSSAFYAAQGLTTTGVLLFDRGGMSSASTVPRDWITDQPSTDDVAFAQAIWGQVIAGATTPTASAQALGAALLDQIGSAAGIPSNSLLSLSPFNQLRRLQAGLDQADSAVLASIFSHACNSLGIPARIVNMGTRLFQDGSLVVSAPDDHSAVEVFDSVGNRWVFLDISLGVLGLELQGVGSLNSADLARSIVDPTLGGALTVLVYDPVARILTVPLAQFAGGDFLRSYFALRPDMRFARNAPTN
jgi:hypothetical protein